VLEGRVERLLALTDPLLLLVGAGMLVAYELPSDADETMLLRVSSRLARFFASVLRCAHCAAHVFQLVQSGRPAAVAARPCAKTN